MLIFDPNSRVEKVSDGLRFFEQDILGCRYIFSGDLTILTTITYNKSGFGFFIGDGQSVKESNKALLFKIGYNDFSIIEKQYDNFNTLIQNAHSLKPKHKDVQIIFTIKKKRITLEYVVSENRNITLGEFDLPYMFPNYVLGIYSNDSNILKETNIQQKTPDKWDYELENSRGGRIQFKDKYFLFENGDHDFELEQSRIPLKAGTYYLKYDTESVNNKNDIQAFVFTYDSLIKTDEETTEDEPKNLLDATNSFTLKEDTLISLKFRGESGKVSNITITSIKDGNFIPTTVKQYNTEGSWIDINLDKVKKVTWDMIIHHVPTYEDLTKEAPYSIVSKSNRNTIQDLFINTKVEYIFEYTVATKELIIRDKETNKKITTKVINPENRMLPIAFNIISDIYSIDLDMENGKTKNIFADSHFKVYVNGSVKSPIIVTDKDKQNSFDISASYREFVKETLSYKLFKNEQQIIVPGNLPDNAYSIKLYGIQKQDTILNMNAKNINEITHNYTEIPTTNYTRHNNIVSLNAETKQEYTYFILEYTDVSNYTYYFTNWEREIIPADEAAFSLEKEILDNSQILMYGVKKGSFVNKQYVYRTPKNIINSIGLYTNEYEKIDSSNYSINYDTSTITLTSDMSEEYDELVIEYKKKDSYAINYNKQTDMYEIEISTNQLDVLVNYDSNTDGHINSYINTSIYPTGNQYVILREAKDKQ